MRQTGTVADHGVRWRFRDIVEYEGLRPEPAWTEADLTPEQLAEIDTEAAEIVAHYADTQHPHTMDAARWGVMEHNGVEHIHRPGRSVFSERPAMGWYCRLCDGAIMTSHPDDFLFIGGPADGRWVATGGAPYYRVPIITPPSVAMYAADPGDAPLQSVATYRREGDRYLFER